MNSLSSTPRMTIKMRFMIILVTLITGFVLFGFATFTAMKKLNVNGEIYQRIVRDKDLVADVLPPPEYIIESYLVALQLMQSQDSAEINTLIQNFTKLKVDYDARHSYWKIHEKELKPEVKTLLLETSYQAANAFYLEAQQQFIPAISKGDNEIAKDSLTKLRSNYQKHRVAIDKVVNLTQIQNEINEAQAQSIIHQYHLGLSSIFIFSVGIASFLTLIINRNIIRQLGAELFEVLELSEKISEGDYDSVSLEIENPNNLMGHLKMMVQHILERRVVETNLKNEILRVKIALDNVNTGVMIADNDLNIVYVNKSVIETLNQNEEGIRSQLPSFDSDNLIGRNIDSFHKNPTLQRQMLSALTHKYHANIILGDHSMTVLANPVIDENGQRLGTVAEWHDRTVEIELEEAVTNIVVSASAGNFSGRLDTKGKEGLFYDLGNAINQLLQTNETSLAEISEVLDALSQGDLTQKITSNYMGTFGQLKDNVNTTVENITEIVHQIQIASENISSGAQDITAGNNDLSRRTEEQAASLEETSASMNRLTNTVQHNAENAKYANQLTENAKTIAEKGRVVVDDVVKTMNSINESSSKVVEIISVIDNIAFQTNILALNAAVEAARAGEQGRGFAVVAIEVRNLAQRAAAAAGEIQMLIDNSVEQVDAGSKLVAQAGKTMQEIVVAVQGVTTVMAEITASSIEQNTGIAQVNQAISQMDDVTQQNATLVEEAAANAKLLEEQVRNLSITVANFKT